MYQSWRTSRQDNYNHSECLWKEMIYEMDCHWFKRHKARLRDFPVKVHIKHFPAHDVKENCTSVLIFAVVKPQDSTVSVCVEIHFFMTNNNCIKVFSKACSTCCPSTEMKALTWRTRKLHCYLSPEPNHVSLNVSYLESGTFVFHSQIATWQHLFECGSYLCLTSWLWWKHFL